MSLSSTDFDAESSTSLNKGPRYGMWAGIALLSIHLLLRH